MGTRGGPAGGTVGAAARRASLFAAGAAEECGGRTFCAPAPPGGGREPVALAAMTDLRREYEARAAIFRRLADELRSAEDRAALLAIAAEYEAEAARLRPGGEPA